MTERELGAWVRSLPERFEANLARLNELDARAGDGDHGTTMLRGLRAAARAVEETPGAGVAATLGAAGSAFRRAAGGASGPLFSSLFTELGRAAGEDGLDAATLAAGLSAAGAAVTRLGRAAPGERTMLDALGPAAEAASGQSSLAAALEAAARAARDGADATATMVARKGRARFVNAGQVEVPDAGATSVALMLEALRDAQGVT